MNIIKQFENQCIVSCQALEDEPLHGSEIMAKMAIAAVEGGAAGIRANSPEDIRAIKKVCGLPVIGIYKRDYEESLVYITPTFDDAREIIEAGAEIVGIDATHLSRPNSETFESIVHKIRSNFPEILILGDVSTYEEGVFAMDLGVDFVSTTLSGYTSYSKQLCGPDIDLVYKLSKLKKVPVMAEGRIWTVEQCAQCMKAGAHSVIIGTAITRPREITRRFVNSISDGC
ncbi:N-acetylmannosamine-6-phosphate 2-epimerase [Virgibacillus necropolis]|uniref:N-acetylmannosamine-6-phosphate 2-epimerase n=1 Tax=Virgibacillus necropolis TaxID=163877 RepID=UPI0038505478